MARPRARVRTPLIVIADDDRDMRTLVAVSLRRAGMDVLEAANGDDLLLALAGLSRARRRVPDLVLSDIHMPGADGLEVLARLKARTPALPVVMMTASGDARTRARAVALGASAVLEKPLELPRLAPVLRSLLHR